MPYPMPQFHSHLIQQIPELLAQSGAPEELYRGHSRLFATEQLLHDLQTRLRWKEVDFNHIVPRWGRGKGKRDERVNVCSFLFSNQLLCM